MKDQNRKEWSAPSVTEYGSVEALTGTFWWDEDGWERECTTKEGTFLGIDYTKTVCTYTRTSPGIS